VKQCIPSTVTSTGPPVATAVWSQGFRCTQARKELTRCQARKDGIDCTPGKYLVEFCVLTGQQGINSLLTDELSKSLSAVVFGICPFAAALQWIEAACQRSSRFIWGIELDGDFWWNLDLVMGVPSSSLYVIVMKAKLWIWVISSTIQQPSSFLYSSSHQVYIVDCLSIKALRIRFRAGVRQDSIETSTMLHVGPIRRQRTGGAPYPTASWR
jgi:hypothetical protein